MPNHAIHPLTADRWDDIVANARDALMVSSLSRRSLRQSPSNQEGGLTDAGYGLRGTSGQ